MRLLTVTHRGWQIIMDADSDAGVWTARKPGRHSLWGFQRPEMNPPYGEAIDQIDAIEVARPYESVL